MSAEFWIFLIGMVLPCAILYLVAAGWLIKFAWDIDEEGCLFRPIIITGAFILIVILLIIFSILLG